MNRRPLGRLAAALRGAREGVLGELRFELGARLTSRLRRRKGFRRTDAGFGRGGCLIVVGFGLAAALQANPSFAADIPPILRTTNPAGVWVLSVAPELLVGNSELPDWVVYSRLANSGVPRGSVGLTDRVELGVYPPGVAYRWGEANGTEIVPAFSIHPYVSHSPSTGAQVLVNPLMSIDGRQWTMPGNNVTLGVMVSPSVIFSEGCSPFNGSCQSSVNAFNHWFLAGQGGIAQTFGVVTVTIGAAVQYTFNVNDLDQSTAAMTFGSRVRHGLRSDPTIRWHVSRDFSLEGHVEYTRNITRGSGVAVVSLGANWVF